MTDRRELVIQGCIINHTNRTPAVTLSGISGSEPLVRCKFTDNVVTGGNVFCTDVNQLTVQNNTIRVTNLGSIQRIPIEVHRGGDSLVITDNLLVNDDTSTRAVISLDAVNQRQVTRALIANNLCFARAGIGIQCLSSNDVAIEGNMIVAVGSCNDGIFLRSESSSMDGLSVRDNDVTVRDTGKWNFGIRLAATTPITWVTSRSPVILSVVRAKGLYLKVRAFDNAGMRPQPNCGRCLVAVRRHRKPAP